MRSVILGMVLFLGACADRIEAPVVPEALSIGDLRRVYVGTTREYADGVYGIGRADTLTLLDVTVSMPPSRIPGRISNGRASPNPERDFALAKMETFSTPEAFRTALARDVAQATDQRQRDVIVYVHGFNNSFADSAFRMAQLAADIELTGPVISYAWPSRANPFGYEYDADSAMFARDGLTELLLQIDTAGADRIVLVGHSMGARVVMEVLRELALTRPGWAADRMAGVLLISPDVNVDVFRSQTANFKTWPQPFVIFKSRNDYLLDLSATLRGEEVRLGNLQTIEPVADMPIVFIDVTNFDDGDLGNHFIAGSSLNFLKLIRASQKLDEGFLEGHTQANLSVLGSPRIVGNSLPVAPMAGNR